MVKAHFSERMVSSDISDVALASVYSEKTSLKKLRMMMKMIIIIIIIIIQCIQLAKYKNQLFLPFCYFPLQIERK